MHGVIYIELCGVAISQSDAKYEDGNILVNEQINLLMYL